MEPKTSNVTMARQSKRLIRIAVSLLLCPYAVNCFSPLPGFHNIAVRKSRQCGFWFSGRSDTLDVSTLPSGSNSSDDSALASSENDLLMMPWSNFQEWALRDNLPNYLVTISLRRNGQVQPELYALWRTMAREVTELSGYTVTMLQQMHTRQLKQNATNISTTPNVLPLLDQFEFQSAGGLSGQVYGIAGVADGTIIETSAVVNVQRTLPKGYVQTEDGAVAYELGLPLQASYSLDGRTNNARASSSMRPSAQTVARRVTGLAEVAVDNIPPQEDPDTMLVRLGASTAVLLAGATAVNMLSHHLTVNVFWV